MKSNSNDETNGRHIIPGLVCEMCNSSPAPKVLDVGAGYGVDLLKAAQAISSTGAVPELYAIETFPTAVDHLVRVGINVHSVNIERERLPFEAEFFDVVICNQVLEHTKELFWIVSELTRVLKCGGYLILGVPNLGSLHNRVALLAGYQPPAIRVLGTHVRGFTVHGLTEFLEIGGVLRVDRVLGGNFYPFPAKVSRPLSKLLPGLSVSSFYVAQRINCENFLSVFKTEVAAQLVDTPYYRGGEL